MWGKNDGSDMILRIHHFFHRNLWIPLKTKVDPKDPVAKKMVYTEDPLKNIGSEESCDKKK